MSVRNRGNYSDYSVRRSGSMAVFRQIALFLTLGLLSFLLGFCVLARLIPGHGPDMPAQGAPVSASGDNRDGASSSPPAVDTQKPARASSPTSQPSVSSPLSTAPASNPVATTSTPTQGTASATGPTIDPEGNGKTQQPSSLDGSPTNSGSVSSTDSGANSNPSGNDANRTIGTAANGSTVTPTHHRRRRRHHTPPADSATPPVETKPAAPADVQPSTMDGTDQPAAGADTQNKSDQSSQDGQSDQNGQNGQGGGDGQGNN